jgi:hypothetical protein
LELLLEMVMVTLSLFFTSTTMSEQACFTSLPLEIITLIIACVYEGEDKRGSDYWHYYFLGVDTRPQSVDMLSCVNRRLREMCLPVIWQVSELCFSRFNLAWAYGAAQSQLPGNDVSRAGFQLHRPLHPPNCTEI